MTTAVARTAGESPDDTIRRTVRALRSAYEVDAAVLARHLGISRQSLYNRLNGAAPWLAAEVVGLAIFFGCEVSDFYTGNVHIKAGGPIGADISGYLPASSRRHSPLSLVPPLPGDYRPVCAGYGSSLSGAADPHSALRVADDPGDQESAGAVNDANAA